MDPAALLENELRPITPEGNSFYSGASGGFSKFTSNLAGFVMNNKGKIAGIGGFGAVGAALAMFSFFLAGPMQIVHAGQVIGEVIDTARDITSGVRAARIATNFGKASAATSKSSRLGIFSEIITKNFENKLARETGVEIVEGVLKVADGGSQKAGGKALSELLEKGGTLTSKESKKLAGELIDSLDGNSIYHHIMKRNLNKMYDWDWYGGIKKIASGVLDETAGKLTNKLQRWVSRKQVENGDVIAKYSDDAGKAIKAAGTEAAGEIAQGSITKFGRKLIGNVTTAIKAVPLLGTAISIAVDFAIDQYFDAVKVQGMLAAAMVKSGEIATMADEIRNNTVPTEDKEGNPVDPMEYAEMIVAHNLYRTANNVDENNIASLGDRTYAATGDCPDVNVSDYYAEDEQDEQKKEEGIAAYNAAKAEAKTCTQELIDAGEEELNSMTSTSKIGSSFFSNTPLQAEFDPNFQVEEFTGEYYRGVSPLLTNNVGVDKTEANLVNALISSVTFVGPKDISDMLEETFDPESLDPSYIGGTSMYGARVQQNDLSASEGARKLTKNEEVALLRETQTHLAEKQMEKSLFARLFDVEDYHSGIAQLSRDAEWDLSGSSPTTHLANVAKTFAALPKLFSKSVGTYTRAASAANPKPYNYGFSMVAHTVDSVNAEPDYWKAEEFLAEGDNIEQVNKGTLKECTGATITKDKDGIKVAWNDKATVDKMELTDGDKCNSYYLGGQFKAEDAFGETHDYTGDDAVRAILANYKTMASLAATSFDEMTDTEKETALAETGTNADDAEKMMIGTMKDMGITYPSSTSSGGGSNIGAGQFGWIWPSPNGGGMTVTSLFGPRTCSGCSPFHRGIDTGAGLEDDIVAVGDGVVIAAGYMDGWGYGNRVEIDMGNGYTTFYAHLNSVSVSTGQTVKQGTRIGGAGGSGGYPIHLHFGVYEGIGVNESAAVDPIDMDNPKNSFLPLDGVIFSEEALGRY